MEKKISVSSVEKYLLETTQKTLKDIYSNKSSDEYKSKGDITAAPNYKMIESLVADLSTLKGIPNNEVRDIKNLFSTLHRPIFKKMVTEYIAEENEKNMTFTVLYTVGYRLLVGELSRIFASTEATDKGIVYKPGKISRDNDMAKLITKFNDSLEDNINRYIKETEKNSESESIQESFYGAVGEVVENSGKSLLKAIPKWLKNIYHSAKMFNPVSYINAIMNKNYQKKVDRFDKIAAEYEATKQAYEEYMKIPESQRNKEVESNYIKNLERYNIRMQNAQAAIAHYDQRAIEDAKDEYDEVSNKPVKEDKSDSPDTGDLSF